MNDPRSAARAIDALRRGWAVAVDGLPVLAVETADAQRLAAFDPGDTANLLISGSRAATLKLGNQRDAAVASAPVELARVPWLDLPAAVALADPSRDLAAPLKGPFKALPLIHAEAAGGALALARLAGLLPAFFIGGTGAVDVVTSSIAIDAYDDPARLALVARARLPVADATDAEIVAFRSPEAGGEHVALLVGSRSNSAPLVRLHSECLTGDVLGSLKCDCGPQLAAALGAIAAAEWGILLYLRQEGRGIGLINKLRAYELQDQGFDTIDANLRLGFAADPRDFGVAAQMLRLLGVGQVRLLTNNPDKVSGLANAGIEVIERVPHQTTANRFNARYLATKRDRSGHQI